MNTPLVSIMIATYNQPAYIVKAVESALAQDYSNLEIIVSDDSTDRNTEQLLRPYQQDARFSYFRNPSNIGRVRNYRRLLFELAKGEWAVMLDGDDFYNDSTYISRAVQFIQQHPGIVLVGAGINVLQDGSNHASPRPLVKADEVFDGSEVFRRRLSLPNHQTDVYRRDLACQLDFYRDPSMGSDSESLFRLCLHGKVAYLQGQPATWRIHTENTTFTRGIDKQVEEIVFIDKVCAYARDFIDANTLQAWRFHMYRMMSNHLVELAKASGSRRNVWKILFKFHKYLGKKQIIKLVFDSLLSRLQ